MGFVKRYWKEAEEKKIPHWHKCAIVELKTGEARVQVRGYENIPLGFMPECPKTFATYEEAFAWLECKLTKLARAVDGAEGCWLCGKPESDHPSAECMSFIRPASNANRWTPS